MRCPSDSAVAVADATDARLPYAEEVEGLLRLKRDLGYKYRREEGILRDFQRFCADHGWDGPDLGREAVEAWCAKRPHEAERGGGGHAARVSVLRQLANHMCSLGRRVHVPVNVAHNGSRHSRFVAHVFTHDEVRRLLEASDGIFPHPRSTMHLVFPVLVRLLYSCGARIGETLSLRMRDVDLERGTLRMEHAKNGKVRLVALSDSMAGVLREFCDALHPDPEPDDYLFCNRDGGRYNHQTIYNRFRAALIAAGIPHGGRGAGPRIHDLRHTFACHTLARSSEEGRDPRAVLPVLSAYLGHGSVRETEVYLRMTSEVYPDVASLVERACSRVVPEVSGDGQAAY